MKDLNICVDIDGTVTEAYYWLDLANEYFNMEVKEEDVKVYNIHEVMGISLEDFDRFYEIVGRQMHYDAKIRPGVKEALDLFYQDHHIHFVTARAQEMEEVSQAWLDKHAIARDSLSLLGSHGKVETARALKCDLFIEDRYENALELAGAGFTVILINTSYNQGPTPANVIRLDSWYEIIDIVESKDYKKVTA